MADLGLYDDLDLLHEQQKERAAEDHQWKEKYQVALGTIDKLQAEKKELNKKIKQLEINFASLLETARTEIKRKDNQIAELRREKDNICFRRNTRPPSTHAVVDGIDTNVRSRDGHINHFSLEQQNAISKCGRTVDKSEHEKCAASSSSQKSGVYNRKDRRSSREDVTKPERGRDQNRHKDAHRSREVENTSRSRDRHDRNLPRTESLDNKDKYEKGHHELEYRTHYSKERHANENVNAYDKFKQDKHSRDKNESKRVQCRNETNDHKIENVKSDGGIKDNKISDEKERKTSNKEITSIEEEILRDVKELKKIKPPDIEKKMKPEEDPTEKSNKFIDALFDDVMLSNKDDENNLYSDLENVSLADAISIPMVINSIQEKSADLITQTNDNYYPELQLQTPRKETLNNMFDDLFGASPVQNTCSAEKNRKNSSESVDDAIEARAKSESIIVYNSKDTSDTVIEKHKLSEDLDKKKLKDDPTSISEMGDNKSVPDSQSITFKFIGLDSSFNSSEDDEKGKVNIDTREEVQSDIESPPFENCFSPTKPVDSISNSAQQQIVNGNLENQCNKNKANDTHKSEKNSYKKSVSRERSDLNRHHKSSESSSHSTGKSEKDKTIKKDSHHHHHSSKKYQGSKNSSHRKDSQTSDSSRSKNEKHRDKTNMRHKFDTEKVPLTHPSSDLDHAKKNKDDRVVTDTCSEKKNTQTNDYSADVENKSGKDKNNVVPIKVSSLADTYSDLNCIQQNLLESLDCEEISDEELQTFMDVSSTQDEKTKRKYDVEKHKDDLGNHVDKAERLVTEVNEINSHIILDKNPKGDVDCVNDSSHKDKMDYDSHKRTSNDIIADVPEPMDFECSSSGVSTFTSTKEVLKNNSGTCRIDETKSNNSKCVRGAPAILEDTPKELHSVVGENIVSSNCIPLLSDSLTVSTPAEKFCKSTNSEDVVLSSEVESEGVLPREVVDGKPKEKVDDCTDGLESTTEQTEQSEEIQSQKNSKATFPNKEVINKDILSLDYISDVARKEISHSVNNEVTQSFSILEGSPQPTHSRTEQNKQIQCESDISKTDKCDILEGVSDEIIEGQVSSSMNLNGENHNNAQKEVQRSTDLSGFTDLSEQSTTQEAYVSSGRRKKLKTPRKCTGEEMILMEYSMSMVTDKSTNFSTVSCPVLSENSDINLLSHTYNTSIPPAEGGINVVSQTVGDEHVEEGVQTVVCQNDGNSEKTSTEEVQNKISCTMDSGKIKEFSSIGEFEEHQVMPALLVEEDSLGVQSFELDLKAICEKTHLPEIENVYNSTHELPLIVDNPIQNTEELEIKDVAEEPDNICLEDENILSTLLIFHNKKQRTDIGRNEGKVHHKKRILQNSMISDVEISEVPEMKQITNQNVIQVDEKVATNDNKKKHRKKIISDLYKETNSQDIKTTVELKPNFAKIPTNDNIVDSAIGLDPVLFVTRSCDLTQCGYQQSIGTNNKEQTASVDTLDLIQFVPENNNADRQNLTKTCKENENNLTNTDVTETNNFITTARYDNKNQENVPQIHEAAAPIQKVMTCGTTKRYKKKMLETFTDANRQDVISTSEEQSDEAHSFNKTNCSNSETSQTNTKSSKEKEDDKLESDNLQKTVNHRKPKEYYRVNQSERTTGKLVIRVTKIKLQTKIVEPISVGNSEDAKGESHKQPAKSDSTNRCSYSSDKIEHLGAESFSTKTESKLPDTSQNLMNKSNEKGDPQHIDLYPITSSMRDSCESNSKENQCEETGTAIYITRKNRSTKENKRKRKRSSSPTNGDSKTSLQSKKSKQLENQLESPRSECDNPTSSTNTADKDLTATDKRKRSLSVENSLFPETPKKSGYCKLFNDDIFVENQQATLPPVYNAAEDDVQYREIDNRMRSMFQSPTYLHSNGDLSYELIKSTCTDSKFDSNENLTINETLSQHLKSQCDTSSSSKRISVGSNDYVIETIGAHSANVFITRKRCKKRTKTTVPTT